MEPNKRLEGTLMTKHQLDLEHPRPGRPAPPWPLSGKVARCTCKPQEDETRRGIKEIREVVTPVTIARRYPF